MPSPTGTTTTSVPPAYGSSEGSTLVDPFRKRPKRFEFLFLHPAMVFGLSIYMILVSTAVMILLAASRYNNGFPVPKNVFAPITPSFLTSFLPVVFLLPVVFSWSIVDRRIRTVQPYYLLSQRELGAEETLLADYGALNIFSAFWVSLRDKHYLLFGSVVTALLTNFFTPFAGGLISVDLVSITRDLELTTTTSLGLTPDFATLNAFLAAAGFTEAAGFQGLPDPPFVQGNWATGQFISPEQPGLNASIAWNTTGIRTQTNCEVPASTSLTSENEGNLTIVATTSSGCTFRVTSNSNTADWQYGVSSGDVDTCGLDSSTKEFSPVMLWFFHPRDQDGIPEARAVICSPTIEVFNVRATVSMSNASLTDVEILNSQVAPNNVTGDFLTGRAFNALTLQQFAGNNTFVQARATAIQSGLPGAIMRFAQQQGAQAVFDSADGFLNLTNKFYTQLLAVSAKSIYFVPDRATISSRKTSLESRLVVDKLAGIALSLILFATGTIGIVVHAIHLHVRRRNQLCLAAPPGSIASALALTSHSGFGVLLTPSDTEEDMKNKLAHLRFSMGRGASAITARENREVMRVGGKRNMKEWKVGDDESGVFEPLVDKKWWDFSSPREVPKGGPMLID